MDKKSSKILSSIFVGWFFISILAIIFFSNINTYYTIMIFGQVFFIMGIAATISVIKDSKEKGFFDIKKSFVLIFVIIGLGCIVIPYLILNEKKFNLNIEKLLPMIFLSIFFIAGSYLLICYLYNRKKLSSDELIKVSSKVIQLSESYSDDTVTYAPVLEYNFNGKIYTHDSDVYSNIGVPNVGDIIEIKVNPQNPEEIYYKQKSDLIFLILGLAFVIVSVIAIFGIYFLS